MDTIRKELLSRKGEVELAIDLLFKINMKIMDWDVPEADDKEGATIILDMMQEKIDQIRADVQAGKYDNY